MKGTVILCTLFACFILGQARNSTKSSEGHSGPNTRSGRISLPGNKDYDTSSFVIAMAQRLVPAIAWAYLKLRFSCFSFDNLWFVACCLLVSGSWHVVSIVSLEFVVCRLPVLGARPVVN